ncbi:MAG: hypothetical protein WAM82_32480 [Thermoanaerobaculia bacterium]
MKTAMGLDLDLNKAMGLDLDLKGAMGVDMVKAFGSVGRAEELAAASAAKLMVPKSYEENFLSIERQIAETARRSFLTEIDQVHQRAMGALVIPPDRLALGYSAELAGVLVKPDLEKILGTASWARASFEAFVGDLYAPNSEGLYSPSLPPSDWFEEELELLLLTSPEYTRSKLAWILDIFVPRLRVALYRQEQEGDFDGAMEEFWEAVVQDPEVRSRLRARLKKSGIREELQKHLSGHLGKVEEGDLAYAILGLYAHIEAFLAELAVQHRLIAHPELILSPKGGKPINRRGVGDLIEALQSGGKITYSQHQFLTYVLSNQYNSNRVRHGMSFEFSQARATALVLALILALCLAWGMEPAELLSPEEEEN